jgi:hypothetical protein
MPWLQPSGNGWAGWCVFAEARAAHPWEPKSVLLYRTIFPQITSWLPDEEGAQLRFEFETEIKRLEAA